MRMALLRSYRLGVHSLFMACAEGHPGRHVEAKCAYLVCPNVVLEHLALMFEKEFCHVCAVCMDVAFVANHGAEVAGCPWWL